MREIEDKVRMTMLIALELSPKEFSMAALNWVSATIKCHHGEPEVAYIRIKKGVLSEIYPKKFFVIDWLTIINYES